MPFARPSLSQLQAQALADVSGGVTLLRYAVLRVLSWAVSGLAWLHYGYLDWIAKQSVPFTATDEFLYAWGALKGVIPIAPASAVGVVTFTGANGSVIPSATIMQRSDGINYISAGSVTVSSGLALVTVGALTGGANTNTVVGVAITLSNAISGVNAAGTVTSGLVGGTDAETSPAFRSRMLTEYQNPPMGGAVADYVEWAQVAGGVSRCWITPNGGGAGTVWVYPMLDDSETAFGGFPQGTDGVASGETRAAAAVGDQLNIANFIYPKQPVTALVTVKAPVATLVNFTIADLDPSDAGTKTAITTALKAVFRRNASPAGTTFPIAVPGAPNGTMYQSQFTAALDAVPGIHRYTLTVPSSAITAAAGHLHTLGTVTYV